MSERFLLVRLSALGDVVCALSALSALRAARPDSRIDWLVEDRFADLVRLVEGVDDVLVFPRRAVASRAAPSALLAHLLALRRRPCYDAVVDLHGNLKSAVHVRVVPSRRRIGPAADAAREGAHFAYDLRVPVPRGIHRARRALRLVAPLLGGRGDAAPPSAPRFHSLKQPARRAAEELEAIDRPRVLLLVGTSAFALHKRWPAERFGDLARRLREQAGTGTALLHGPGEEALAARALRCDDRLTVLPPDGGLPLLVERLRRADLVVGCDSGPLLLASALGTPTVTLFGPKDPAIYAPPFAAGAVARRPPPCAPCTRRRCSDPVCMTGLSVDDVARVVHERLAAS